MRFFSRARANPDHGNGSQFEAMKDMAAEVSEEARRRLADTGEEARHWFAGAGDMLKTFVTNQPALALGAALAAGVLIGWLFKRR
jgi:ElaB/YqjD/DUF883 family membrane-anchored ribosome-binding protein